eukprot:1158495-Pelagomonas_calceolata.AAC.11
MPPGSTLAHSRDALCTTHAFQSNVTGKAQVEASWHGTSPLVPACAHSASINRLHSERSNSACMHPCKQKHNTHTCECKCSSADRKGCSTRFTACLSGNLPPHLYMKRRRSPPAAYSCTMITQSFSCGVGQVITPK